MGSRRAKSNCVNSLEDHIKRFDDIVSIEECKKIVRDIGLNDENVLELRDYIIGITNSAMEVYLKDFR